jgi:hypothetical protein
MLVRMRNQHEISAKPEIALQDLRDAEAALGGTIPDDLLALWIATNRSLGDLVEATRSVALFYEAMEEKNWRKRFKFAHVAFDDSYNRDEGPLCTPLGQQNAASIVFWFLRKADGWDPTFLVEGESHFVSYCRWKLSTQATTAVDFSVPVDAAEVAALRPCIVEPTALLDRRVKHPKFGEGVVLRTIEPDKLEIDFGAHGVRKLIATTVEDIA